MALLLVVKIFPAVDEWWGVCLFHSGPTGKDLEDLSKCIFANPSQNNRNQNKQYILFNLDWFKNSFFN